MSDPVHIVCPHCTAVNRLPQARLADGGTCGKCHKALFDGHPAVLTSASFDKHIARNDVPVVVDVWAPWCGPCRAMAPVFEKAAAALEPGVRFAKLNSDEAQDVAGRLSISSIPTVLIFKGGREIARTSGAQPLDRLVSWVRAVVAA